MANVQVDLITPALSELGIVGQGQTASANDSVYALSLLNRLIDLMKIEGLMVPYPQTRTTQALGAVPTISYTVGSGGTFNVARPPRIDQFSFYDTSITPVTEFYTGEPLTDEQYAAIAIKTLTSNYPTSAYYNPTFGSTGFATLYLYPVPTSATLVGVIYAPSALAEFSALTDTVSIPPGYREYFVTQLAIRLAGPFKVPIPPSLTAVAARAAAAVAAVNLRKSDMQFPAESLGNTGGSGYFSQGFYSGWSGR